MLNLDIKIKVSFESQNVKKKMDSSPPSIFLTIKMFQFELHQHIDEIRTDILVYQNGGGNKTYQSTS